MATTTKSALAAELSITKARVSQYVKAGLPVRSDGKLDREEALNWIALNQRHALTGNKGARRAATIVKEQTPKRPAPVRRPGDQYEPEVEGAKVALIKVGEHIARETLKAGGSVELAYTLHSTVVIALDDDLAKLLGQRGFRGFANGYSVLDLVTNTDDDLDWAALAAEVGKTFDERACEGHLAEIMFPPGWTPEA